MRNVENFLTLPVPVASAERSFSKQKIIMNYLLSTMNQESVYGPAVLSIEQDITKELDTTKIIHEFASKTYRRVSFQ